MAKTRKSSTAGVGSTKSDLLTWALQGLEQEIAATRQRLAELESQARQLRTSSRGATPAAAAAEAPAGARAPRQRRKLSADARRRIAEAQKRRWAKVKAGKE